MCVNEGKTFLLVISISALALCAFKAAKFSLLWPPSLPARTAPVSEDSPTVLLNNGDSFQASSIRSSGGGAIYVTPFMCGDVTK